MDNRNVYSLCDSRDGGKIKIFNRTIIIFSTFVLLTACTVHKPQPVDLPALLPESFTPLEKATDKIGGNYLIKADGGIMPPSAHTVRGRSSLTGFTEEQGQTSAQKSIGQWWKIFNDPRLNALMDEAFTNNLDLAQAFARLDQLKAVSRTTSAAQRPFLDIEGKVSRERQTSFIGDYTGNSYGLSLAAGYELDLWNKLKSRTKAANLEVEASREDAKALYLSLSARLVDLYYLAVEQRSQLELSDRTIESFQDTLERVELRYHEGLVPTLNVYRARLNLAGARAKRPVFEANLSVAEHSLSILLGHYPERETAGMLATIPETPAAFPAGLPSELLSRRPDIQAALSRLKASDERVGEAIANRFPSFNLLGSYGYSSTAFTTGDITGVFWNLLLSLAQPVLDGGRRTAEIDRSRAVFKENLAIYHKTVLAAFQEVEDALVKNRTTEEQIDRLTERLNTSSAELRLSLDRYMQGLSDYLPVLVAQQHLYESESALITARRQLISDRVQLARALGGEWMDKVIDEYLRTDERKEKNQ